MPFVKDSLSLLIETAGSDLTTNTKAAMNESVIRSSYNHIAEASEPVLYGPEVVPVVKAGGEYFTEMNFLQPFMKSSRIKSISEALNAVAEANGLEPGAVGILIESDEGVTECIEKAIESANPKKKKAALDKMGKATDIVDKLKAKGVNVKKKIGIKCKECGKVNCECKK